MRQREDVVLMEIALAGWDVGVVESEGPERAGTFYPARDLLGSFRVLQFRLNDF